MNIWLRQHGIILILILLTTLSLVGRLLVVHAPDTIAGDEVYFVNFARAYFGGDIYYDVHPPLGKMIIALGIAAFGDNPFGWRFTSALLGAALIPVLYWFGTTLFRRRGIGLSLAALAAADGYLFVLSRVAVMDIGLLITLLVGYTLLITSVRRYPASRMLFLAGVFFGLAISIKWFAATWFLASALVFIFPKLIEADAFENVVWQTRLRLWFVYLFVPSATVYVIAWFSHFLLFTIPVIDWLRDFGIYNFRIFNYHTHIVDTTPYRSPWWSWPLMIRPWQYFHETDGGFTRLIVVLGTPSVWLAALITFVTVMIRRIRQYQLFLFVGLMLVISWVPFAFVTRPMFNYHFLMSWPFWMLPLAVLLNDWRRSIVGRLGIAAFVLVTIGCIVLFWPLWNAIPLYDVALRWRLWFPGWL